MLRVSHQGEGIDDADTIDGAREIVRGQAPGRYDVDEIRAEPLEAAELPIFVDARPAGAGESVDARPLEPAIPRQTIGHTGDPPLVPLTSHEGLDPAEPFVDRPDLLGDWDGRRGDGRFRAGAGGFDEVRAR
jgi:hypothetical protein